MKIKKYAIIFKYIVKVGLHMNAYNWLHVVCFVIKKLQSFLQLNRDIQYIVSSTIHVQIFCVAVNIVRFLRVPNAFRFNIWAIAHLFLYHLFQGVYCQNSSRKLIISKIAYPRKKKLQILSFSLYSKNIKKLIFTTKGRKTS